MSQEGSTLRARLIIGAVAAVTVVAAAAWIFAEGSPHSDAMSAPGQPARDPSTPSQVGSTFPIDTQPRPREASGAAKIHAQPIDSTHEPNSVASARENTREDEWLPNPSEDFGPEDAAFEERYGEPTPELIRESLAAAFRERFPERKLSPEEERQAGDALVRIRQIRLAMRGLPFTQEHAEERQAMISEYEVAVTEFERAVEMPLVEFTEPSFHPDSTHETGGGEPSGNSFDMQFPEISGGLDNGDELESGQ